MLTMPFFDFKCERCGHEFLKRVSNEDKGSVKCPQCGHNRVRQLLSPFFAPGSRLSESSNTPSDACRGCNAAGTG